jgi:hypothetical protein
MRSIATLLVLNLKNHVSISMSVNGQPREYQDFQGHYAKKRQMLVQITEIL